MLDLGISLTPLFFKFYLFIYSQSAGSLLPRGLSLIVAAGATLPRRVRASHCGAFSVAGHGLPGSQASHCGAFSVAGHGLPGSQASHCGAFSVAGHGLPGSQASVAEATRL